jgi:hypothetical protein
MAGKKSETGDEGVPPEDWENPQKADEPASPDDAGAAADEIPPSAVEPAADPLPESDWTRPDDPLELKEPSRVEPVETEGFPGAATAPAETPDEAESYDEHHEEEQGRSFAARALTVLLLLLAGAAFGLWAAPRIAPHLPSGMAPVARWLTPGAGPGEAEIAALSEQVEVLASRVAGLSETADVETRIEQEVASAVGEAQVATAAELEEMRTSIAGMDATDMRQQLARLEGTLDGQIAELTAMKDQITGGIAASSELTEDAVAQIDVYRAEMEGLRAEMGSLAENVAALRGRIDEVAATAERSISAAQERVSEIEAESASAQDAAAVQADVAQIRAALATARPFEDAAERLQAAGVDLPEALADAAASGVPTMLMLRERFPDAAQEALRASSAASAGDGFMARSRAFLEAQVATRSLTPQEGMSPDAVLSRMEEALRQDDLAAAIDEAGQLPSEAQAAMSDWLADARARAAADSGLAELGTALPATN